jgi:hypothetical protein
VLALLFAAVCGGLTTGAAQAVAAPLPMSACTDSSGVVLAVDFSHWGGPLLRSCGTTPTTGYTQLNQGGWVTTGTAHDGPALICRIGYSGYQGGKQYPTPQDEPCVLTPPATAYWSYWHADPGKNTWSYGQLGTMSYHPEPGSVDLWTFGATNIAGTQGQPTFSPDTVRARNTSAGGGSPSAPPQHTESVTHTMSGAAPGTPTRSTATPSTSGTTGAAEAAPGMSPPAVPRAQDAEPTAAVGNSSGSVLPVAITAAVVALIAGVVIIRVRQRRSAG